MPTPDATYPPSDEPSVARPPEPTPRRAVPPARRTRLHAVVDHIDAHLAEPLPLPVLAALAHVSPWHFHRLFQAEMGETVADCVRRRRLETAALRLLRQPPATVLAIAVDVGFGSAEALTRAFRLRFGMPPGAWRDGGWRDWATQRREAMRKLGQAQRNSGQGPTADDGDAEASLLIEAMPAMNPPAPDPDPTPVASSPLTVRLKTVPPRRLAYMRHVGPYGDPGIARLWARFEAWCRAQPFDGPRRVLGVGHDSPDVTAPEQCRYDCCVEVGEDFRASGDVGVQSLPGGWVACVEFHGPPEAIHAAWMQLFAQWLPESGYQTDDRPAFEDYGLPEVEVDPETGAFRCELCLPVRPV